MIDSYCSTFSNQPILTQPCQQRFCIRDQEQNHPDDFCPLCQEATVQKRGEENHWWGAESHLLYIFVNLCSSRPNNVLVVLIGYGIYAVFNVLPQPTFYMFRLGRFWVNCFVPGSPWDPAAEPDQWVAKAFHHLDAELDHRQHKSYRCAGPTNQSCKNLDTGPGGENAHRAKKCWPDDIQMKIMISPYQFIEILLTCVLRSSRTLKAKSVKSQGNKSAKEFGKIGNISNPGKAEASLELKFGSWFWSPT